MNGVRLIQQQPIRDKIQEFYKSLMRSAADSLPAVNKEIMRRGPVISQQQALTLCQPVSEEEIYEGLKRIKDDKAPSVDGYNALFYKKA